MQAHDAYPNQDELLAPFIYEMGKVLYLAQQFETNLLMLSSILSHQDGRVDAETFKDGLKLHETLPLGLLAKAFREKLPLPKELADFLKAAIDARNAVVHGFLMRNTLALRTSSGREELIQELREAQHIIDKRRQATELALERCLNAFGGTLETIRAEANRQVLEDVLSSVTRH